MTGDTLTFQDFFPNWLDPSHTEKQCVLQSPWLVALQNLTPRLMDITTYISMVHSTSFSHSSIVARRPTAYSPRSSRPFWGASAALVGLVLEDDAVRVSIEILVFGEDIRSDARLVLRCAEVCTRLYPVQFVMVSIGSSLLQIGC